MSRIIDAREVQTAGDEGEDDNDDGDGISPHNVGCTAITKRAKVRYIIYIIYCYIIRSAVRHLNWRTPIPPLAEPSLR